MALPQVDVGIVTYNTRDLSVRALRRLLDTDQGCELTVYVRDNGSEDGTAEAVRDAVPETHVDAGSDNLGFAAGVNLLMKRSSAPWFLALNSDAWPEPGAIAALVDAALRHPEAAAVAPRLERPDGTLEHSTHPFPSLRVACLLATGAHRLIPAPRREELCLEGAWSHDRARLVDWAVGAALLMRREAILDVGGFDERYFMYTEDLEWCWRARERGWGIWFEPAAVVRHVGNASGEAAYGSTRTSAYLHNTHRFYVQEHGSAAASAYRIVNTLGSYRLAAGALLRGDTERSRYWRRAARAHKTSHRTSDRPTREQGA